MDETEHDVQHAAVHPLLQVLPALQVLQALEGQRAVQALLPAEEEAISPPLSRQGQLRRPVRRAEAAYDRLAGEALAHDGNAALVTVDVAWCRDCGGICHLVENQGSLVPT